MIHGMLQSWRNARDLPRELWVLFLVTLVNRMGTMALPFLALYLANELKYSPQMTGLVISCYGIGAMVTSPIAGYLSDRWGAVRLMRTGLLTAGGLLLLYPWIQSSWLIIALTILWAVFSEAFRPASLAIVGEYAPVHMRKVAFAVNRLAINLGMSIGPSLGGFLVLVSYDLIFYINGSMALIAGIFLTVSSLRDRPRESESPRLADIFSPVRDGQLVLFLLATVLVLIVFFQNEAAMPLFLVNEIGLTESAYGLIWLVNTGLIILLEIHVNMTMSHWSNARALAMGALLVGLGYGLQAAVWELGGVIVTFVIWTFGEMIFFPTAAAFTSEIAPENRRGQYMGLLQMMFSIAFVIGPWAGTTIMAAYGSVALWVGTFGVALIAVGILHRLSRMTKTKTSAISTDRGL